MTMMQRLLQGDKKAPVVPKTDRQLLEAIFKKLEQFESELEDLRESLSDDNWREEKKELKAELKTHTAFIHAITMSLVEGKKANDGKPTALEAYQLRKAEEAKADATKPNGARKLPG